MGKWKDLYKTRSRCPACRKMVVEGTKHKCPQGRDRDPFINPKEEK